MQYFWNQHNAVAPASDSDIHTVPFPVPDPVPDPDVDVCAVCFDVPGAKNVSITACGHIFCTSCLLLSLKTKNTCPTCRAEVEPERSVVTPITVSVATELIRDEERMMEITRRIQVINTFSGRNGRYSMIFAICREMAFATAHSIARWQKTTDQTYDDSWIHFDSSDDDDE
jgi:hypothetical protein